MKKATLLLMLAIFGGSTLFAQSVTGKWKTIDDETGQEKSIVEIYKKDGKVYGKIIEIMNPDKKDAKCIDCPGADKGKPLNGLVIIKGLQEDDEEWNNGKILDPTDGKLYKCLIALEGKDTLKVRGYVGFALLGRTQYWKRMN